MIRGKRNSERGTGLALYETAVGWGAAVSGAAGLIEIILPFGSKNREELIRRLAHQYPQALESSADCVARETAVLLTRYFAGDQVSFADLPVDLSCFSPFQQEVYRMVAAIPSGKVLTYAAVAAAVGRPRAARGIGSAMGRNPLPVIIPCHRVVGSSGAMTGYSAQGGVASKQWLLHMEGIRLTETGRIRRNLCEAM